MSIIIPITITIILGIAMIRPIDDSLDLTALWIQVLFRSLYMIPMMIVWMIYFFVMWRMSV